MPKSGRIDVGATRDIGDKTIEAIDVIGKNTAEQIKATADDHLNRAVKLVDKLKELADAIEQTTQQAAVDLQNYCDHVTHVLETVQGLQVRLNGVKEPGIKQPAKLPEAANITL